MRSLTSLVLVVAAGVVLHGAPGRAAPSTLEAGDYVFDLAASPDGRWLAASPSDSPPVLFYVGPPPNAAADGAEPTEPPPARRELACPPASIDSLTFTPDSQFLIVEPKLEDSDARLLVFATASAELAFEIDCAGAASERRVGPKHIFAVRPGSAASQFYVVRNDGLALWDAGTQQEVSRDPEFDPRNYFVAADGSVAVAAHGAGLLVLDPTDHSERLRIEDESSRGQLKPATKKNQSVLGLSMSLVGLSSDGAIVVVACSQEKVMDRNKLANPNADPEDRLKAVKHFGWLEAFHTASGESAWVAELPAQVYRGDVRCAGERVCVEVADDLRLFDIRTGKSKGKISASAAITAQASADGESWWYADEKGHIRSK